MQFDHATIVTADVDGTRAFFEEIAGLSTGPRPPFGVDGYWLYLADQPVVHVVRATVPAQVGRAAPRIDHIALRVKDGNEWSQLLDRLQRFKTRYQLTHVPLSDETQLSVPIAPGLNVEFITSLTIGYGESDAMAAAEPECLPARKRE